MSSFTDIRATLTGERDSEKLAANDILHASSGSAKYLTTITSVSGLTICVVIAGS